MNNPLKLFFLIFNLVPSLTSSVNNFSQSLSESELQMGQNASQIVERGGATTLVGGIRATEVWSNKKGESQQKELTLSFPVVRKLDGKKGFLIPFSLHSENYFVGDKKIGGANVLLPSGVFASEGIAYAFLDVYPEF